ncbi:hypothetical protein LOK49_LG09G01319 [Camellia lanceoleosa]|uniref:Uncharacterized protein n=1 Tax=Camellia lanceoleosa TaxID=1840588 RepID=A0ACC0GMY7_9ERIC|nr:hypothetical protein LOK49_LG09G01319 [Camellia lanceoleosa]
MHILNFTFCVDVLREFQHIYYIDLGFGIFNASEPEVICLLYEARANTGIDRMKIINAAAKSVPAPHKVDLNNPDKNLVVQIVKETSKRDHIEHYQNLRSCFYTLIYYCHNPF